MTQEHWALWNSPSMSWNANWAFGCPSSGAFIWVCLQQLGGRFSLMSPVQQSWSVSLNYNSLDRGTCSQDKIFFLLVLRFCYLSLSNVAWIGSPINFLFRILHWTSAFVLCYYFAIIVSNHDDPEATYGPFDSYRVTSCFVGVGVWEPWVLWEWGSLTVLAKSSARHVAAW